MLCLEQQQQQQQQQSALEADGRKKHGEISSAYLALSILRWPQKLVNVDLDEEEKEEGGGGGGRVGGRIGTGNHCTFRSK